MVCVALLLLGWCYFESFERQPFRAWVRIVFLFLGVRALHLLVQVARLQTRCRASGMALLTLVGLFVVLVDSALVTELAFGVD
jgi:hypothetical protein